MFDLKQNYFELFLLPVSYDIDLAALTERYRELQKIVHPDRFTQANAQEKRWSLQAASLVNAAYQVLCNDLKRADYILLQRGIDLQQETSAQVDPEFLITQMAYRESLEVIPSQSDPMAAIGALNTDLRHKTESLKQTMRENLSKERWKEARDTAHQWQFMVKLKQELDDIAFQLEEQYD